jgi:hypothetical protein
VLLHSLASRLVFLSIAVKPAMSDGFTLDVGKFVAERFLDVKPPFPLGHGRGSGDLDHCCSNDSGAVAGRHIGVPFSVAIWINAEFCAGLVYKTQSAACARFDGFDDPFACEIVTFLPVDLEQRQADVGDLRYRWIRLFKSLSLASHLNILSGAVFPLD